MNGRSVNFWKYSTIGLLVAFVLGLPSPREVVARAKPVAEVLMDILANTESIKAKTNTLPADPASQSAVNAGLASIQSKTGNLPADPASQSALDGQLANILSDTGDIKNVLASPPSAGNAGRAVLTHTFGMNPLDGTSEKVQIISPEPGKVFYGHINGSISFPDGNTGGFTCVEAPGFGFDLGADITPFGSSIRWVNSDFVCTELYISVSDKANGVQAGAGDVIAATIVFQTVDITP